MWQQQLGGQHRLGVRRPGDRPLQPGIGLQRQTMSCTNALNAPDNGNPSP
jgi:hypothetical protein